MSTTRDLVQVLKQELKDAQLTYADVAVALQLAESSVKRIFAKGDMPLSRIDDLCRLLKLDFADLARRVADTQPLVNELTLEQERAVIADPKLLLVAICALSQWTYEQILETYQMSAAEIIKALTALDRLGVIELRPLNRYRLKLAKTFRWHPHGPVMKYFRDHVISDYYAGSFAGEDECLHLVHGSIAKSLAPAFCEKIQRIAQDFSQQHLADQRLGSTERDGYTLILGMRSWEYKPFTALRR